MWIIECSETGKDGEWYALIAFPVFIKAAAMELLPAQYRIMYPDRTYSNVFTVEKARPGEMCLTHINIYGY